MSFYKCNCVLTEAAHLFTTHYHTAELSHVMLTDLCDARLSSNT